MALEVKNVLVRGKYIPVPWSNADNMYDLMLDVARAIREEPRRYDQATWIERSQYSILGTLQSRGIKGGPACGTMACRAGWMVLLSGNTSGDMYDGVRWRAEQLLDFDDEKPSDREYGKDIGRLFSGGAIEEDTDDLGYVKKVSNDPTVCVIGSAAYAEVGASGVEVFAAKWATRLKALPVKRELGD